jgi:hypothetical protein
MWHEKKDAGRREIGEEGTGSYCSFRYKKKINKRL